MEYRYILNGRSLTLDKSACVGCGICREVCPHGVFKIIQEPEASASHDCPDVGASGGKKAVIRERNRCMECGACALNCPSQAILAGRGMGCAAGILNGGCCGETGCC